ncbi:MAG: hypothetical protein RhofKO_35590 [Rhodothermales bacterium]
MEHIQQSGVGRQKTGALYSRHGEGSGRLHEDPWKKHYSGSPDKPKWISCGLHILIRFPC